MITKFKLFEKLGIDKIVYDITEKIWVEFLKKYDKNKVFSSEVDRFDVDVSEYINWNIIGVSIKYNNTESRSGFPIQIGAISRLDNTKIKTLIELKEEIIHEVQHIIHSLRKSGKVDGTPRKIENYSQRKKNFLNFMGVHIIISSDLIGSFSDENSNVYKQKISLINFMKCDKFSEKYKKLIIYLYLSEEEELSSRLHEFIVRVNNLKDDSEIFKNEKMIFYKEMRNFKMSKNDFIPTELKKINNSLFKLKDMKKVEKYINMKGEKFIRKVYKLSYFKNSETNL